MFSLRKVSCVALLAAAWLVGSAGTANATFTLKVNGTTVATGVSGTMALGSTIATSGTVTFAGVSFKLTADSFFDSVQGIYVVNTTVTSLKRASTSGSSLLTIEAIDDSVGFASPLGNPFMVFSDSQPPTRPSATGSFSGILESEIDGSTVISAGIPSFNGPVTTSVVDPTAFVINNRTILTIMGKYSFSQLITETDVQPTVTPAPAGILLAVTAMPIFGLFGFMKRRKVAIAA